MKRALFLFFTSHLALKLCNRPRPSGQKGVGVRRLALLAIVATLLAAGTATWAQEMKKDSQGKKKNSSLCTVDEWKAHNKRCFPAILVEGDQPGSYVYVKAPGKSNGSQADAQVDSAPDTLPDDSPLIVVVENINPLQYSYSITTSDEKVTESSISDLTSALGVKVGQTQENQTKPGKQTKETKAPVGAVPTANEIAEAKTKQQSAQSKLTVALDNANKQLSIFGMTIDANAKTSQTPEAAAALSKRPANERKNAQETEDSAKAAVKLAADDVSESETALKNKCDDSHSKKHDDVQKLQTEVNELRTNIDTYSNSVSGLQEEYSKLRDDLMALRAPCPGSCPATETPNCSEPCTDWWTDRFNNKIKAVFGGGVRGKSETNGDMIDLTQTPTVDKDEKLQEFHGDTYAQVADALSNQAVSLYGKPASDDDASCKSVLSDDESNDQEFLKSLFSTSGTTPSYTAQLKTALSTSVGVAQELASNLENLKEVASKSTSFILIHSIDAPSRSQNTLTIDIKWQDVSSGDGSSQASSESSGGGGSKATAGTDKASGSKKDAKQSGQTAQEASKKDDSEPDSGETTITVQFGHGAFLSESGGVAFSPLAQHSYALGTVTGTAGGPCTPAAGVTANGCIVDNGGSGWRATPVLLGHVRLPYAFTQISPFLPGGVAFGVSARSGSSSSTSGSSSTTTIEYLTGLSWMLGYPKHHLDLANFYVTVGGYLGSVEGLGGGLQLGVQPTAPPTSLPTTQSYRWGLGLSLTYRIASQGGTAKKNNSNGKSTN